ncbi:2'-5' RNA ligase family protein [Penaeicola halotolerans]|uniref:2'-5' RNA ligase family protein n=1 Tax=Penaeicola halotolerans TaxID=2793196 RepID=UPI001CF8E552|nr:2'-5' RNA ligase family protein [Penaeicola halotolerans]
MPNPKDESLYFIALVPEGVLQAEVMAFKNEVATLFNSKQALRSPAHITLQMPFLWKNKKYAQLSGMLHAFSLEQKPLELRLGGFGHFGDRVIYIKVGENNPLKMMQADLKKALRLKLHIFNDAFIERPFHPHMTIAFRDLKKAHFDQAFAHFKEKSFHENWICNQLCLLKHDGKYWQVIETFTLGHE